MRKLIAILGIYIVATGICYECINAKIDRAIHKQRQRQNTFRCWGFPDDSDEFGSAYVFSGGKRQ